METPAKPGGLDHRGHIAGQSGERPHLAPATGSTMSAQIQSRNAVGIRKYPLVAPHRTVGQSPMDENHPGLPHSGDRKDQAKPGDVTQRIVDACFHGFQGFFFLADMWFLEVG